MNVFRLRLFGCELICVEFGQTTGPITITGITGGPGHDFERAPEEWAVEEKFGFGR